MTSRSDDPFTLGPWLVDPRANEIRRDGEAVRLEPKAVAVLTYLAERSGEAVTRDELLEAVWPEVVVTDASLTRCISQLRQALGDDSRSPRLIETLPKVGYRLLPPPEAGAASGPPSPPRPDEAEGRRLAARALVLGGIAVAGLVALALWVGLGRGDRAATPVTVEYRVDVTGSVADAVVTYTGPEGRPAADSSEAFPFERSVEVGAPSAGTYRLGVRGRSSGAVLTLSAVVRRGEAVLAQNQTTGTVEPDSVGPFRVFTLVQFSE